MTYVSSLPKQTPEIWAHLQTAARLPLPENTRHKTIPIGTRYGRLEINSSPFKLEGYNAYVYYECKCDCGNCRPVRSGRLSKGTVSCGCRMKETSSENGGLNKRNGTAVCACGTEFTHQGTKCHACSYQKNSVQHNKRHKEWLEEQESNPYSFIRILFSKMKSRETKKDKGTAGRVGIARKVQITIDFVCDLWDKQNGRCALTGIEMVHRKCNLRTVSIDRIDSDGDYTEDNTQLVCYSMNLAKRDFPNSEIIAFVADIRNNSNVF